WAPDKSNGLSGKLTDLNDYLRPGFGWELSSATGINDSGQIVGTGIHDGDTHAFLLTPSSGNGIDFVDTTGLDNNTFWTGLYDLGKRFVVVTTTLSGKQYFFGRYLDSARQNGLKTAIYFALRFNSPAESGEDQVSRALD